MRGESDIRPVAFMELRRVQRGWFVKEEIPMGFGTRKTAAMFAVLIIGLGVAWAGFLVGSMVFGLSIVICFLVWILGARFVHENLGKTWHRPKRDWQQD